MGRLNKPMYGKQPRTLRKRPEIVLSINANGSIRVEGPLANEKLCRDMLKGASEALDGYYAKQKPPAPVAEVVKDAPALPIEVVKTEDGIPIYSDQRELKDGEFVERLIEAGWTREKAEEEWAATQRGERD